MSTESFSTDKRKSSYGEHRSFRGVENYAIERRMGKARLFLKKLRAEYPERQLQILELGCGFWGRNLQLLKKSFPSVQFTGVDLKVTPERMPLIELIQADITQWKPTEQYDGILSLAVVEHLLDPRQHFNLIADSLRSKGLACLTTPTPPAHFVLRVLAGLRVFDPAEISDHEIYFTETGLRNLAKGSNLVVEEYNQMTFGLNQSMLLRKY